MEWRPIDTAPKDGTFVLLWVPYEDVPVVGRFKGDRWVFSTAHYTVDCMAYCYGGSAVGNGDEPSHWMHLPPPPATEGQ